MPNLVELSCGGNELDELDLEAVPNLSGLVCNGNLLTKLDLSSVPNLEHLSCYSNNLIELDLGTASGLKKLSCQNNDLTELDLSQVSELAELNCGNNNLNRLDLRAVPDLVKLNCLHNDFAELFFDSSHDLESFKYPEKKNCLISQEHPDLENAKKNSATKIDSHELSRRINVGELNRHAAGKIRIKDSSDELSELDDFDGNPELVRFFELIDKGCPLIYLSGKAGTGKSTIIRKLQRRFKRSAVVVAPTGVAAINIDGQTIHSFFGFSHDIICQRLGKK